MNMKQHQHLSLNKLNQGKFFLFSSLLCFCSLVDGFALWCLMNSHIHTLVAIVVDLIMLSSFILSSLSFVNRVINCAFIYFIVPSPVASLL